MNSKLYRFTELLTLFRARRLPISYAVIAQAFEVSEKTASRYVAELRDNLHAPVKRTEHGFLLDESAGKYELPGIWLTNHELIGLATTLKTLNELGNSDHIEAINTIQHTIEKLLADQGVSLAQFYRAIKLLPSHKQSHNNVAFQQLSQAILKQQRVLIDYLDSHNTPTQREISPQQLVHYQENWYADTYCHLRKALRQFRINRIQKITPLNGKDAPPANLIQTQTLQEHFASAYGIFAGKATHTAKLRFFDYAATEVAQQQWHPQQSGEWQGSDYLLSFPYNKDTELIRDILKYANNVEVISPSKLRNKVARIVGSMVNIYAS